MTNCLCCGSDDIEREGIRTDCIECGAYAIELGSKVEWVHPRTIRRVDAMLSQLKGA